MEFEWDSRKATGNLKKHKIDFKTAITVFDDPHAFIAPDEKHSTRLEKREWIIGESDSGVLVVVFTKKITKSIYRLISARRANKKERRQYEEVKEFSF